MKLITAIVDPDKLDNINESLKKAGVKYLLVMNAKASAVEGGFTEHYRGTTYITDYLDLLRVDIVVDNDMLDSSVSAILDATAGDSAIGRIITSTIDQAIDIGKHNTGIEGVA